MSEHTEFNTAQDVAQQVATRVGTIVAIPSCADCRRQATPRLPLTQLPDGTFICPDCQRQRAALAAKQVVEVEERPRRRKAAPPGSLYALLGLPMDATEQEIATALTTQQRYWMVRQAGSERVKAKESLDRLRQVTSSLGTAESRRAYDEQLRQTIREERRMALAEHKVRPLEDWPGRSVSSLKELVQACEVSPSNWQIGERKLVSRELLLWARFAIGDEETVQAIEDVLGRRDLSQMRKLDTLLYSIDPERPYRFYTQPGTFEVVPDARSMSTVANFISFADRNWELAMRHLYDGELVTWLANNYSLGMYQGTLYYSVGAFYDAECQRFAKSTHAGVGLEALLEYLDKDLPLPQLAITFDDQEDGYSVQHWDGELPHAPVTVAITNTTRGFFAGQIELLRPSGAAVGEYPWLDFIRLPLEAATGTSGARIVSGSTGGALIKPCTLQGVQKQEYTLHLGHFDTLPRGAELHNSITLSRFESSPTQPTRVATYPVALRLMRFREGYRAKLWAAGLRGSLPGAVLDGGTAFAAMLIIFLLGQLFTPQTTWGFFSPQQDFASQSAWPALLDVALTMALRPFFLAVAIFGFTLPAITAGVFVVCGLFTGLRRGHTKFSARQDAHVHRSVGLTFAWITWIGALLAAVVFWLLTSANPPPLANFVATHSLPSQLDAVALTNPAFEPGPAWLKALFILVAVVMPGVAVRVVTQAVVTVRTRLYASVATRWGSLLNPPGKG